MTQETKKKGAKGEWLTLRVTAVLMCTLSVWLVWFILSSLNLNHSEFKALLSQPWNAFAMIAILGLACIHAILGIDEIVTDYIHSAKTKHRFVILAKSFLILIAMASAAAIMSIVL